MPEPLHFDLLRRAGFHIRQTGLGDWCAVCPCCQQVIASERNPYRLATAVLTKLAVQAEREAQEHDRG